jgi:phosphohistidine phosphatase
MKLLLVRHGQQNPGDFSPSATLTTQGRSDVEKTIFHLDTQGFSPDSIYTSPLKRAVETAEMISSHFGAPITVEEGLGDYFDSNVLIEILCKAKEETLCFVGHSPTLPDFARSLCPDVASIPRGCALILEITRTDGEIGGQIVGLVTSEG